MARMITPDLLYRGLQDGTVETLLDLRTPDSYEDWHLPGTINLPYHPDDTFPEDALPTALEPDERVVIICAEGQSSTAFAKELTTRGFENIEILQDGMAGWSRLYRVVSIPTAAPQLECFQFQRIAKGCLSYLICSFDTHEAVAVDPSRHLEEYEFVAEDDEMTITDVIDTHVHADHVSGGRALADETGATYHLPAAASDRGVSVPFEGLDHTQVIELDGIELKAIETPGHTSDSMAILINAEAVLTADTLFVDAVGRTELEAGAEGAKAAAEELYESIHRSLLTLPDATTVLPGHHTVPEGSAMMNTPGDPVLTTVGDLRESVDLLQASRETFIEAVVSGEAATPPNYERLIAINTGQDQLADTAEAITLELGPNRCAAGTH